MSDALELSRQRKLKKYYVPSKKSFSETILDHGCVYSVTPQQVVTKLQEAITKYSGDEYTLRLDFESEHDYYDTYHNLVLEITRPLTKEEQDVLIAKGEEEEARQAKKKEKEMKALINRLKKKYPDGLSWDDGESTVSIATTLID